MIFHVSNENSYSKEHILIKKKIYTNYAIFLPQKFSLFGCMGNGKNLGYQKKIINRKDSSDISLVFSFAADQSSVRKLCKLIVKIDYTIPY